MIAKVYTFTLIGIEAHPVEVEVDISRGLPQFNIVGLPDNVVKESKERIRSAIRNSGYAFPVGKITVNLAPAQLRKEGSGFDFPIAIGILVASGIIPSLPMNPLFCAGELSLNGRLRPINGVLSIAIRAKKDGINSLLLPFENASEAFVVEGIKVYPLSSLADAVMFLSGRVKIEPYRADSKDLFRPSDVTLDFSDVKGQSYAKRGLEIASAGGHNVIMVGPPGSGKTMLAERLPGILPPLTFEESLETSCVYSVAGLLEENGLITNRPFRSPHHSISYAGLIGGGSFPKPGEVSLAHNGVLFLDEFPEFKRSVIELLRQPMETGKVTIARASGSVTYPARFMLVAAMNPCPCGYFGSSSRNCSCSFQQIENYRRKISGPIMDRIDIHIEVPAVKFEELMGSSAGGESSDRIRERVIIARNIQLERFKDSGIFCNASMNSSHLNLFVKLDRPSQSLIREAMNKLGFSARAYHRILKVARTIADLEESPNVKEHHLFEAIQFRILDRTLS